MADNDEQAGAKTSTDTSTTSAGTNPVQHLSDIIKVPILQGLTLPDDTPSNKEITLLDKVLKQHLESYVENMAPKTPLTIQEGAGYQKQLFNLLQAIMKLEPAKFTSAMDYLIKVIEANRSGVFNELYVYRYLDHVALSKQQLKEFENLVNLLLLAGQGKSRTVALQQVDLEKSLSVMHDVDHQQKMVAYFQSIA